MSIKTKTIDALRTERAEKKAFEAWVRAVEDNIFFSACVVAVRDTTKTFDAAHAEAFAQKLEEALASLKADQPGLDIKVFSTCVARTIRLSVGFDSPRFRSVSVATYVFSDRGLHRR